MATLSESLMTPSWLRVELSTDYQSMDQRLNVGFRCRDGWAHIVSLPASLSFSNRDMTESTKREVYERLHQFITKQLAIETLENT